MHSVRNVIISGKHKKPITIDAIWDGETSKDKQVIVFAHGFKGFKDWGHWEAIGKTFAKTGFLFVKFNFSHNGVTPDDPLNFGDLDAFGRNNYSIELDDLDSVLNWLTSKPELLSNVNFGTDWTLIGHSRGGGIALVKASEDNRVSRLITWAAVSELGYIFKPEVMEQWKTDQVFYTLNGRTKQQMPLNYQFYENYLLHKNRLSSANAISKLQIPYLILHGSADPAVPMEASVYLAELCKQHNVDFKQVMIEGANHVFGGKHPFNKSELPKNSHELVMNTINFITDSKSH